MKVTQIYFSCDNIHHQSYVLIYDSHENYISRKDPVYQGHINDDEIKDVEVRRFSVEDSGDTVHILTYEELK